MKISKSLLKSLFICVLLIFVLSANASGQSTENGFKWQEGEVLKYGVYYSFFRLGSITLNNLGKKEVNNAQVNHIRVRIESNPLLFWLNYNTVYDSYVTDKVEGVRFVSDEKIDGKDYNAIYDYDYAAGKLHITLNDKNKHNHVEKKSIDLIPRLIDGISLIYFARVNSMTAGEDSVNTFIEDKSGKVKFNFTNKYTTTKVDSLPNEVRTIYFNGMMHIKGVGGVTGPFESWFSADNSRVPILSHMEVFIGHVDIELESWQRWSPPYKK